MGLTVKSSAVMLGGPDHGRRYMLQEPSNSLTVARMPGFTSFMQDRDDLLTCDQVTCESVRIPVGRHTVCAVRWPDVRPETAQALLADYVLAAWEKYDITHNPYRRS